ncbi:MAG: lysophospholipid acyltransferase family protein [Acidimicrobiales bacterium]
MAVSDPTEAGPAAVDRSAHARRALSFQVDPRRSPSYRVARVIVTGVLRLWFRPRIRHPANMPADGPAIIAPVHRSNIDFGFAAFVTDRKLFYMAKEELWKMERFGHLLESLGAFPVQRSGTDRESVRRAEEVLHRGQVLVMFPEGARRSGEVVEELAEGVAFLAARTGAPIVPVGIGGSQRAMPKGARFPKPIGITVSIGEPIEIEPREEGQRVARSQIHRLSETLRERLQAAYDDAAR